MNSVVCRPDRAALLKRYDKPGPRYTSYPTIDQCAESIGPDLYVRALEGRSLGSLQRPLSLYVHVPFCASICYYCACNKVVTRKNDQVQAYLEALYREADWLLEHCGALSPVMQFHIGGGTPTFLTNAELTDLVRHLEARFVFSAKAERSIEVDPRTVSEDRLVLLRELGFNRLSFGVQDFNLDVQKAVNRVQSFDSVRDLMTQARALGFKSINVDLIYGLPHQTLQTFQETIEQVVGLDPDRVALYSYAHLPERFKPQRRINVAELPTPGGKVAILDQAISLMQAAGYEYIGMDHFAKPTDALAKARRQGALHRNFQGYSTLPEADLLGLGVSAISRVGPTLVQNTRDLDEYLDAIDQRGSAVFRGHVSDRDDLVRYSVIMALLCQGVIEWADFKATHWIDFDEYFAAEMSELYHLAADGLVEMTETHLAVTETGWFFVRPIAMVFDRYIQKTRIQRSAVL